MKATSPVQPAGVLLSIIVPVYNEADTVVSVLTRLRALEMRKEIIVVNDGSTDRTREALEALQGHDDVTIHHNPVNLGKGASVRIGFSLARGEILAIQDADLELDPKELVRLVEPIVQGTADVVYGSRFLNGRKGRLSFYVGNRALTALTNVLYSSALTDMETCYKIIRADVVRSLGLRAARFEIEPELTAQILKRGHRIVELPVDYSPRSTGSGKKLSWKDGLFAVLTLLEQRFARGS